MKVQMEMNDIREALYGMYKVTSAKRTHAHHRGLIYLRAQDNIELWVAGEESFIRAEMKGEVIEEGEVAFDARQFYKSVKKLNKHGGNLTIELEGDNYWLSCSSPQLDFRMAGNHPDDFPKVPEAEGDWKSLENLTTDDLDLVSKTASVDDARARLCGVHFGSEKHGISVVSTDGSRLTKIDLEGVDMNFPEGQSGFTISREAAEVAAYILGRKKTDEEIRFAFTDSRYMGLKFDRYEVYGKEAQTGSNFPDYTQVLPTSMQMDEARCFVDRETMRKKIDVTSLFASPKTSNIRLKLDAENNELEFYASDYDKGEGRARMNTIEDVKSTCKAGYNYKYLLQAVDSFEESELAFIMIDSLSPTMFHVPGDTSRLLVVMPMRL